MGFDPQKFFIGVVDFFSVLLPGMVVTYLVAGAFGEDLLGETLTSLAGAEAVAAFLVVSYLLGHFVFLLGALLLDEPVYGPLRDATPGQRDRRRGEPGEKPPPTWLRLASRVLVGRAKHDDQALRKIEEIKADHLGRVGAEDAVNAYQWSKAKLLLQQPSALAKVERLEADSKFFRSLAVLFAGLVVVLLVDGEPGLAAVSAGLLLMAVWRYIDQRLKGITRAYTFIITMEALEPPAR